MCATLLVPMHLDILMLEQDQLVHEATADFSRLPYSDGTRDINADIANISESVVAQPFQNQRLRLRSGIHLHWAIPDALTRGIHTDAGTEFPRVPNRWLILRSSSSVTDSSDIERAWIVESDYLYPDGTGDLSCSVTIPVVPTTSGERPFRYLGRKMPLEAWLSRASDAEYLDRLTAVGYGEPTFAAFYPNCHSVFGFFDDDITTIPESLRYDVIGWYSDPAQDHLKTVVDAFRTDNPDATNQDLLELLQEDLAWTVALEDDQQFPENILCYARIIFDGETTASPPTTDDVTIAVGNTGTEALSAYLARTLNPEHKALLEDQLEALHLAFQLEHRRLDVGPKFREARHEKGFAAVPNGSLWTIRPDTPSDATANAIDGHAQLQIQLPMVMANQLHTLNELQHAYDYAMQEIETMRKQLFSDWYKYMLSAYPPDDSRDDFPNIDEVRNYIEQKDLAPLEDKIATTGTLLLQTNEAGQITAATSEEGIASTLATRLAEAINILIAELATFNASEPVQQIQATYGLRRINSPRYWQPNEPVVTMIGEAVRPTPRHGQDGRLRDDGLLECTLLANSADPLTIPDDIATIRAGIDAIEQTASEEHIAFRTWEHQPWHPFLLEWEVEALPTIRQGNLDPRRRAYEQGFITNSYALNEQAVDLTPIAGRESIGRAASLYRGSSILTGYANAQLSDRIAFFLQQRVLSDYYDDQQIPPDDQEDTFLRDNIGVIRVWYETNRLSNPDDPAAQANDPVYTALRSYEQLQTTSSLSQSLSGFNEALLMHRQTMQLRIDDPLGFADYRVFSDRVRDVVQMTNRSAPEPLNDFQPIRSGVMQIHRLRVVDTFGQSQDLNVQTIITTEELQTPGSPYLVSFPPRFVQPACLNFRWLAANDRDQEVNDHPATTPICGWVLPNNLDESLAVYDESGQALGLIDQQARWRPAPGSNDPVALDAIANLHLRQLVNYVVEQGAAFLRDFLQVINTALANIDPENAEQHQELALLIGRPMAVVRASLSLDLQGVPAIHQGWNAFRQDMRRNTRETDDFTRVEFPVRIGEYMQLNDGLVGYWIEDGDRYRDDTLYAPQSNLIDDNRIVTHMDDPVNTHLSVDTPPQMLTMLVDPRGKVHATSGILPTKAIDIPPDHYVDALQAIEITFLTAPVVTTQGLISLPVPEEPGYAWSWLRREGDVWVEVPSDEIAKVNTEATFAGSQEIQDGWLKLRRSDES